MTTNILGAALILSVIVNGYAITMRQSAIADHHPTGTTSLVIK